MSKYKPLWAFIKSKNEEEFKLTFEEIESILGFPIDHSFLTYKKELLEFGFQVVKISMKEKYVFIKKINKERK